MNSRQVFSFQLHQGELAKGDASSQSVRGVQDTAGVEKCPFLPVLTSDIDWVTP